MQESSGSQVCCRRVDRGGKKPKPSLRAAPTCLASLGRRGMDACDAAKAAPRYLVKGDQESSLHCWRIEARAVKHACLDIGRITNGRA